MSDARRYWLGALSSFVLATSCHSSEGLPAPSLPLTPTHDAEFRERAPRPSIKHVLRAPSLALGSLSNGLKLIVAEDDEQSTLSVAFAGRAARVDVLKRNQLRLAELTLLTMLKSAGFDGIGQEGPGAALAPPIRLMDASSSGHGTVIEIAGLADAFEPASTDLASVLTRPQLEERSFQRAKARLKAGAARSERALQTLRLAASRVLYGPDYLAPSEETDADLIEGISFDQVRALRASSYVPRDSALIFAGPITLDEASALAQPRFGAWTGTGTTLAAPPPPNPRAGRRLLRQPPLLDGSDLLVAALPCPVSTSPDELAMSVISTLLDGALGSDFARKLRHETGMTYTWSAHCVDHGAFGTFYFQLQTGSGDAGQMLEILLSELERLSSEPLRQDELEAATMGYLAEHAASLSSSRGTAHALAHAFLVGRPDDYFNTLESRVRALTPEALRAAAHRYFEVGPIAVVSSGKALFLQGHPHVSAFAAVH